MFKQMRRQEREIGKESIERILREGEYGVLASSGQEGYGYAIPLSYVYHKDGIYFHCANEGHKLDNIKYNSKVSFCVVGKTNVLPQQFSTEYESVVVFGTALEVEEQEKKEALIAILDKYSKEYKEEGLEYIQRAWNKTKVIKIEIDRITGKGR